MSNHRKLRYHAALLVYLLVATVTCLAQDSPIKEEPAAPPAAPMGDSATASAPAAAPAEDNLLNLDIEQLGTLDIRGPSASPASPAATSVPSTTVDILALSDSSASSTGELFNQAPSVSVRRTSSINLDPRIRGYTSEQLNASANGVKLYKTRIDIDSLFSQIDPGLVDSLSVIDGPYTSEYGPGFAFLISGLTHAPRYDDVEFHGRSIFQQETNGRQLYWRESLWGGGTDWGFFTSYGQRTGNDYQPGNNSFEFRVPASYNQWDSFTSLSKDLSDWSRVEFTYLRAEQNDVELPGVVYDIEHSHTDQFNVRWVAQDEKDGPERAVVQYWYSRTPYFGDSSNPSNQRTLFRTFITENLLGLPAPLDVFNVAGNFVDGGIQSTGFRSLIRLGDPDDAVLTLGADWRRYQQRHFENAVNAFGQPALSAVAPGFLIIPGINDGPPDFRGIPNSSQEDWGLFTDLQLTVLDNLKLRMGSRVDFTTTFVSSGDPIAADEFYQTTTGSSEPSEVLALAFASGELALGDHLSLEGGVGFGMSNPTLSQLYSDVPSSPILRFTSPIIGNSDLDPEKDLQFDLGIRGKWEAVRISGRVFHATIQDYILPVPIGFLAQTPGNRNLGRQVDLNGTVVSVDDQAIVVYKYANSDRATLWGSDLTLELQLGRWVTASGSAAYTQGTNHSPLSGFSDNFTNVDIRSSSKSSEPLPNIYPLNGTVGLRVAEPDNNRWSLGISANLVHGQDYVADNLGEINTSGFTTFALRGHFKLREGLIVRSSIENLFDRTYTEHGSLAIVNPAGQIGFIKEPGISWILGLEAQF